MFWIGFLVGILVIPAVAFLILAVLFSIDLIPYTIKLIKKYFNDKKVKKGLTQTTKSSDLKLADKTTSEDLKTTEVKEEKKD